MPDLGLIGWIIVGLLAGGISGWFVGAKSVQGCLPTMVVGILGGAIGGWIATQINSSPVSGFFGALAFAIIGSIIVRLILRSLENTNRR
jgi:uncharacterized membrane protein YeaQ/YmgE (transglycosylase-associated protein family)